jgi:nicotinate-nucleotide adenylyltransferase
MLSASIPGDSRIIVDACEIRRGGISYTIDTIADISRRYRPEGKMGFLIGDDLAATFSRWRRAEDIAGETDIIIAHRNSAEPVDFPYPCTVLDNPIMDISSAGIRKQIQNGEPWRSLVSQGARFIIEDRRLYGYTPLVPAEDSVYNGGETARADRPDGASPEQAGVFSNTFVFRTEISHEFIVRVEAEVRSLVSSSRFIHSRGVALMAYDLCVHFGLNPDRGYLAGIAHDIAKSLPDGEMMRLARGDGKNFSKLERKKPSLLHGRAGAVLFRQKFGIGEEDILEAIQYHTTGNPGMRPLAKVVYIADKIENSRGDVNADLRDFSCFADLDRLFTAVLEETVAYLRSKQLDLSAGTLKMLDAIHNRRNL